MGVLAFDFRGVLRDAPYFLFPNCIQTKNNLKIIKKVLDILYSYLYNKDNKGKQKEEQKNDKV